MTARPDSAEAFKRAHGLGRFAADFQSPVPVEQVIRELEERGIITGARCTVDESRRGYIRFIGPLRMSRVDKDNARRDKVHVFVGVELDEKTGKNDGSLMDTEAGEIVRHFSCEMLRGLFVAPSRITLGAPEKTVIEEMLDDLSDLDE
ncbi:uncharacterized protein L969DRAFT_78980 [Mixia osmundae IAM 14324]|uniref:CAP-Gly domain-containing protein n=1 Tax=Mixia osmundae (strain CBS 9802 / IAM 14324 / JCM 22182 / KY 12970) TaxID=764103 RepID=G7DZJ2_MIXOS|nr:uncharacterized protein L969DRAFT_78980 [Mixia osmundae IAM 14324]KEI37174.1 hypothetical protein L969DRAFT_78980 [Mixia osmundae IAM 14324]GAA96002.1 hypothetical protein E5Q_02662 [Mixia osmundae IAM 14324]